MHRLFISFNRQDWEKVFKIKKQIESTLGEKCWMDLEDIERGDFAQQILHAIEESYIILFFYSKNSENSQWQRRELEFAIHNNKTIIPLLIDNIPNDSWYYHHLSKYKTVWTDELHFRVEYIPEMTNAFGFIIRTGKNSLLASGIGSRIYISHRDSTQLTRFTNIRDVCKKDGQWETLMLSLAT